MRVNRSSSRNGAQQFARMHIVAATFSMSVNNPAPAISGNGAAIAPRPSSSAELAGTRICAAMKWQWHDAQQKFTFLVCGLILISALLKFFL
jgi:hypothetical protein